MAKSEYLTAPLPTDKMPKAMPYILANEACERFAFYGMSGILIVFMTKYLLASDGTAAPMGNEEAMTWFHFFKSAVYFLPIVGALLCDLWSGKYKTIIVFSLVYCVGFIALVVDGSRLGLIVALVMMAIGGGIIKPCVSANVGDQFGKSNKHLLSKMYGWFYFAINLGAAVSMALCPILLERYNPKVAFGIPMLFMMFATIAFWAGHKKFVHVPAGGVKFVKEVFSGEGLRALGKLCIIFLFVAMFWALFDQSQSSWVLQAEHMNLNMFGLKVLPAQLQAVNPVLVMIMIPLFSYGIYPLIDKVFHLTALRKITIGLFVASLSFLIPIWIENQIVAGARPHIWWQVLAYVILTAAEIMISITCLEFSYTQAPKKMKSFIQAVFLMSIAVGNAFTAVVNWFIQNEDGTSKLAGASYYWFFTIMMLVTACIFIFVAASYKEKTYIQDEASQA